MRRHNILLCVAVVTLAMMMCLGFSGCSATQDQADSDAPAVEIDYDNATVSYLGPQGTYTEEACGVFFEHKGRYIPYETVNDAVHAMLDGESKYAVIPQENTIGGAVIDYVDTLIAETDVSVVGEVDLPISQNLLVLPGADLNDIRTVYDRPLKTELGEYYYLIECADCTYDEYEEFQEDSDFEFRYLGSFSVK